MTEIRGQIVGNKNEPTVIVDDGGSIRAYVEHQDYGSGAIVELYMTPYNTFGVNVMLDNGTIIELCKGAVAGNSLTVDRYGPTWAVDEDEGEITYLLGR